MKKTTCDRLCMALLVISGLLWGIVGLFDFNLVMYILGPCWAARVLYFIFGLAAVCVLFGWKKMIKR